MLRAPERDTRTAGLRLSRTAAACHIVLHQGSCSSGGSAARPAAAAARSQQAIAAQRCEHVHWSGCKQVQVRAAPAACVLPACSCRQRHQPVEDCICDGCQAVVHLQRLQHRSSTGRVDKAAAGRCCCAAGRGARSHAHAGTGCADARSHARLVHHEKQRVVARQPRALCHRHRVHDCRCRQRSSNKLSGGAA